MVNHGKPKKCSSIVHQVDRFHHSYGNYIPTYGGPQLHLSGGVQLQKRPVLSTFLRGRSMPRCRRAGNVGSVTGWGEIGSINLTCAWYNLISSGSEGVRQFWANFWRLKGSTKPKYELFLVQIASTWWIRSCSSVPAWLNFADFSLVSKYFKY